MGLWAELWCKFAVNVMSNGLVRVAGAKRVGMGDSAPSLLQELHRGRRTEVDHLNGPIVELGQATGIATLLNALVVRMCTQ